MSASVFLLTGSVRHSQIFTFFTSLCCHATEDVQCRERHLAFDTTKWINDPKSRSMTGELYSSSSAAFAGATTRTDCIISSIRLNPKKGSECRRASLQSRGNSLLLSPLLSHNHFHYTPHPLFSAAKPLSLSLSLAFICALAWPFRGEWLGGGATECLSAR